MPNITRRQAIRLGLGIGGAVAGGAATVGLEVLFDMRQSRTWLVPELPLSCDHGTLHPIRNPSNKPIRIYEIGFTLLPEPSDKRLAYIVGEQSPPYDVIFADADFDNRRKHYSRQISDLQVAAGETAVLQISFALTQIHYHPNHYGRASVKYGNTRHLQTAVFDPTWIAIEQQA